MVRYAKWSDLADIAKAYSQSAAYVARDEKAPGEIISGGFLDRQLGHIASTMAWVHSGCRGHNNSSRMDNRPEQERRNSPVRSKPRRQQHRPRRHQLQQHRCPPPLPGVHHGSSHHGKHHPDRHRRDRHHRDRYADASVEIVPINPIPIMAVAASDMIVRRDILLVPFYLSHSSSPPTLYRAN